jgi:hypothetical protein
LWSYGILTVLSPMIAVANTVLFIVWVGLGLNDCGSCGTATVASAKSRCLIVKVRASRQPKSLTTGSARSASCETNQVR